MADAQEMQDRITKFGQNMARLDAIINGPETGSASQVETDNAVVPTIARALALAAAAAAVYGLGAPASTGQVGPSCPVTTLNNVRSTRCNWVAKADSLAAGGPAANLAGACLSIFRNATTSGIQVFFNATNSSQRIWFRSCESDVWGAWVEIVTMPAIEHIITNHPVLASDYGAVGDRNGAPVVERTQLQAAWEAAKAQKKTLKLDAQEYLVDSYLGWTNEFGSRIMLEGRQDYTIIRPTPALAAGATNSLIRCAMEENGAPIRGRALTANIVPGRQRISVDNTGMLPGMLLAVQCSTLWYTENRGQWYKGELHRITRIVSGGVEIEGRTRDFYATTEAVAISAWLPSSVLFENIYIDSPLIAPADNTANGAGFRIDGCYKPRIFHCGVRGTRTSGINLGRSVDGFIDDFEAERIGKGTVTDEEDVSDAQGYGIYLLRSRGTRIRAMTTRGVRRSVDGSGDWPNRDTLIDGLRAYGGLTSADGTAYGPSSPADGLLPNYGVGDHGPDENMTIVNSFFSNLYNGITHRGRQMTVRNCEFVGPVVHPIYSTYGSGLIVDGCKLWNGFWPMASSSPVTEVAEYFVRAGNSTSTNAPDWDLPFEITNNSLVGLTKGLICFSGDTDFDDRIEKTVKNLVVRGNSIHTVTDQVWYMLSNPGTSERRIAASDLSGNFLHRLRQSGQIRIADPRMILGGTVDGVTLDAAVKLDTNRWAITLDGGGDRARIWSSDFGYVLGTTPVLVRISCADASVSGMFSISPGSAALTGVGAIGGNLVGSATALIGTGGASDKLIVYLDQDGIWFQNNRSSVKSLIVTLDA